MIQATDLDLAYKLPKWIPLFFIVLIPRVAIAHEGRTQLSR